MSYSRHFAVLVTSGNGNRCDSLKSIIRTELFSSHEEIGESKFWILKNKDLWPDAVKNINSELAIKIKPLFKDLDKKYYSSKDSYKDNDINDFRFLLEKAMKNGFWGGQVGLA